jgi:hypothetical protein
MPLTLVPGTECWLIVVVVPVASDRPTCHLFFSFWNSCENTNMCLCLCVYGCYILSIHSPGCRSVEPGASLGEHARLGPGVIIAVHATDL